VPQSRDRSEMKAAWMSCGHTVNGCYASYFAPAMASNEAAFSKAPSALRRDSFRLSKPDLIGISDRSTASIGSLSTADHEANASDEAAHS
jgi:hypothetical protein